MNKDALLSLLRHGLTAVGTMFAASHPGWLGSSEVDTLVGALVAIAGVMLSQIDKIAVAQQQKDSEKAVAVAQRATVQAKVETIEAKNETAAVVAAKEEAGKTLPTLGLLLLLAFGLSACSISSSLLGDVASLVGGSGSAGGLIARDMVATKFNLEKAVEVGALRADDPALGCLQMATAQLGIGQKAPSFEPQRAGVLSEGAIIYIRIQQAKKLQGGTGADLPVSCLALIGLFVQDGAKLGQKAFLPF